MDLTRHERIELAAGLTAPALSLVSQEQAAGNFARLKDSREETLAAVEAVTAELLALEWGLIGEGMQRQVFAAGGGSSMDAIVKIPHENVEVGQGFWGDDGGGFYAHLNSFSSLNEVMAYEDNTHGHPVMPCRLVWHESGLPIVVMERLSPEPADQPYDVPGEMKRAFDGGQIGWSALLGTWAGFDAGFPPNGSLPGMSQSEMVIAWHKLCSVAVAA